MPKPKGNGSDMHDFIDKLTRRSIDQTRSSKESRKKRREEKKKRRNEAVSRTLPSDKGAVRSLPAALVPKYKIDNSRVSAVAAIFSAFGQERHSSDPFSRKPNGANTRRLTLGGVCQPRKNDYGGIGLARPSLLVGFDDPALLPKIEAEFKEHIPGFFGKQKTKQMKKEASKKMLWKQLADKKDLKLSIGSKQLAKMTPEQKVEQLIQEGYI